MWKFFASLVIFLFFVLFTAGAKELYALIDSHNQESITENPFCEDGYPHVDESKVAADFSHLPHRLPKEHFPFPEEDQKESTDGKDWDEFICLFTYFLQRSVDLQATSASIRQLNLSVANREAISFFIIYHSWKSFLS